MKQFERESRYFVFKISDIKNTPKGDDIIKKLCEYEAIIAVNRHLNGKKPLECVVVESDWPEYSKVWISIENRMCKDTEEDK